MKKIIMILMIAVGGIIRRFRANENVERLESRSAKSSRSKNRLGANGRIKTPRLSKIIWRTTRFMFTRTALSIRRRSSNQFRPAI